jgi:DNA-binding NarL/FixJ family response regulator
VSAPLRVLVADDHPLFREGLRFVLETTDDLQIVAEASNGADAVRLALREPIDLALFDIHMPGMNGIEATREVRAELPDLRVLMLTMFEDDASVFAALRAGARGYVLKDATRAELVRAIRAVAHGEAIFSPSIASRVLDFFANRQTGLTVEAFPMLTARERDVLNLLAEGQSNAGIAARLGLTSKTTSNYVSSVLTKLQVSDRHAAARKAREQQG